MEECTYFLLGILITSSDLVLTSGGAWNGGVDRRIFLLSASKVVA
jgi:hypothetical protein